MESCRTLIAGAGVTGLAFANFIDSNDLIVLERDTEIGGYCKTVKQDGFVWDYSGHFFHFRHKDIEQMLVSRMPPGEVQTIARRSKIYLGESLIDFPFQKNIHQLPKEDFIDCLYHLFFKDEARSGQVESFEDMVYARFGKGITDRFLKPYNEKLYACALNALDAEAMGRFFPYADLEDIVRNMKQADNSSYNATFTYPRGGAFEYVKALAAGTPAGSICTDEALLSIDLEARVATTSKRQIRYEHLVSTLPFDALLRACGLPVDPGVFHSNKVLVYNLGFDRKGWRDVHWAYFPEKRYVFYRVGFYDNIFASDRMSLYIELGAPTGAELDVEQNLVRTLEDLKTAGIVDEHQLVSSHTVTMNPAYVHITQSSAREVTRLRRLLGSRGVYSAGRYGGWTYCSIEDNILEARELAEVLKPIRA
ncbi:MAG: LPS biosynthesis protein [Deltaproteobacteria bacterium CG2_30_63_29]|nr:MAG: LPS biosynthesis protein [Deltaproteobacteria bacterium CG2_30_63_29]PJB45448.1 MAG: LPS biosynthesis protein [Deltaproteobacteria bacterium CG_4_9_14_3_um_filter_63_12]